ncbi:Zinc-type alcohol dehydrogenase-like protein, partial [Lachnellula subtilissima]
NTAQGTTKSSNRPKHHPRLRRAGTILSTGPSVTRFTAGSKVLMHMLPHFPASAFPTMAETCGAWDSGSTARCASTASLTRAHWCACRRPDVRGGGYAGLFGLDGLECLVRGREDRGGGGCCAYAGDGRRFDCGFAAGATVIATTSSAAKATRLSALGAAHTINYNTTPNWGEVAKSLTPSSVGVTNVIDVGGLSTLSESLKAVRVEGIVTATGVLGSEAKEPSSLLDTVWSVCSVRGIVLGSKRQFEDMVKFIEEKDVRPVVDERIFWDRGGSGCVSVD